MFDISSNFAKPFDDSSKEITHGSIDQTVSRKDGLDSPSTQSMRRRHQRQDIPQDTTYVSSCSDDDSTEHPLEEENDGLDVGTEVSDNQNDISLQPPKEDLHTCVPTSPSPTMHKNNHTLQEICNMSIASSSHPALQENDADVDVGPTAEVENLKVEVDLNNIPIEVEEDLKERIVQLEKQLSLLNCTLQGLLSVSGMNNRLEEVGLFVVTVIMHTQVVWFQVS